MNKPLSFGVLILTIDIPLLATSILGPKRLEFGTTGFAIANGIQGLVLVLIMLLIMMMLRIVLYSSISPTLIIFICDSPHIHFDSSFNLVLFT